MSLKKRLEKLEKQIPERPVTIPLEERGLQIDGVLFKYGQLKSMSETELAQWGPNTKQLIEHFVKWAIAAPGFWFMMSPDPEVSFEIKPDLGWRFMYVITPPERRIDEVDD